MIQVADVRRRRAYGARLSGQLGGGSGLMARVEALWRKGLLGRERAWRAPALGRKWWVQVTIIF